MSDQENEINALREKVQSQENEISNLKLSLQQLKTDSRMEDVDLNARSIDAGAHYVKEKFAGAPIEERQLALNIASQAFGMGVRWCETNFYMKAKEN